MEAGCIRQGGHVSESDKPPTGRFYLSRENSSSLPPARLRVKLVEEKLPRASLASLGNSTLWTEAKARVKVVASPLVLTALLRAESFSDQWEDGGFLIGRAYIDTEGGDNAYLVCITAVPRARATMSSLVHLTYTGDSFSEVKRLLRDDFPGQQLLGWYHTHLFAAEEEMGLSGPDVHLHFSTFRQPWQVAALINLPLHGPATLRFYATQDKEMVRCTVYRLEADRP
jgi:hypothetical protein